MEMQIQDDGMGIPAEALPRIFDFFEQGGVKVTRQFGGLGLGLFESFVGAYLGALYQDPVMFCILILVALWQSRKIRFGGSRRA